jgi:hypothetical protein
MAARAYCAGSFPQHTAGGAGPAPPSSDLLLLATAGTDNLLLATAGTDQLKINA